MLDIDILTEGIAAPDWLERIYPLAESVCAYLNINDAACSVVFCNNEYIASLNSQYRGIEGPTDVLSFCASEGQALPEAPEGEPVHIGDIVVSLPYVEANAERFAVAGEEEIRRVVIHGLLHLFGYTHETNEKDEEMLLIQEELVQSGDVLF